MSDTATTVAILAVVVMLEGVRRIAPDAFVLRRVLWWPWRPGGTLSLGRDWHLVAWPLPVVLPLVLPPDGGTDDLTVRRQIARIRARARRARAAGALATGIGSAVHAAVVVGIPLATRRWDVFGLLVSLEAVLLLCVVQALVTHAGLRRAGAGRRAAFVTAVKVVWPFTAPRAAELVQEQVVRGAEPMAACAALLGRERLLDSLRARVYDAIQHGDRSGGRQVLEALYTTNEIATFLRQPPSSATGAFCPRCASEYRAGITECANCEGVSVLRGASETPHRSPG